MKFIAKRKGNFMGNILYFQEDTKWSESRSTAKKFSTKEEAIQESDFTGLYDVETEEV